MIDPIRDRRTFLALRADGVRVRRGALGATYLDDGSDPVRVGYAITTRVGGAVVRNRIRRRLRSVLADLERSGSAVLPSGALLISVGPDAIRRTPDELRNDVVRLLDALESRRRSAR
ncbi:MAG: ribonuclease P protein component [Actinobacteria bacterium]|nr:ribonuclease P protein component [Actinomycetota bacterium]